MVSFSLQSLTNLSCIRIAYLLWTRRDVTKSCAEEVLFEELIDDVIEDVEGLPLPKNFKLCVLKHVIPAGRHLLSLLNFWLSYFNTEDFEKWLTNNILFNYLILNADGLINQRLTARNILGKTNLDNKTAFRFACINFLEEEVLDLWILVKKDILKTISDDAEMTDLCSGGNRKKIYEKFYRHIDSRKSQNRRQTYEAYYCQRADPISVPHNYYHHDIYEFISWENKPVSSHMPFTEEPYEVLFWIGFCFARENGISIQELPHFLGDNFGWIDFSLQLAAFYGNVACFDYFKNFRNFQYNYINAIERIILSRKLRVKQPSFVFHFLLLNAKEKAELFVKFPYVTMIQILQWPMSLMFLQNPQSLWDLIPDMRKHELFREILLNIFNENIYLHPLTNLNCPFFFYDGFPTVPGMFNIDHLTQLFVDLWEISPDSCKNSFMNPWLFHRIVFSRHERMFREKFAVSGLAGMLFQLFLCDGATVLELFEGNCLKDSLRNIVSKYMPEHLRDLHMRCLVYLVPENVRPDSIRKKMVKRNFEYLSSSKGGTKRDILVIPQYGRFVNKIINAKF